MTAKSYAESLARELTLSVADRLGVELKPGQAVTLYCRILGGIEAAVGNVLSELEACGELDGEAAA